MHMLTIDFSLQSQPLQKLLIIGYIRGLLKLPTICASKNAFFLEQQGLKSIHDYFMHAT